jgi:hypothetical protein
MIKVGSKLFQIFIFIVLMIICEIIFSKIYKYYNGYSYETFIVNFISNFSKNTTVETKNFIINVSRFHWGISDSSQTNKDLWFTKFFIFERDVTALIIILGKFDQKKFENLEKECDINFSKTTKTINDWEADIYDCVSSIQNNLSQRYIVYNGEYFFLTVYSDIFQPQYDKFFEGVRLKEQ